jgi:hypothetical protein
VLRSNRRSIRVYALSVVAERRSVERRMSLTAGTLLLS